MVMQIACHGRPVQVSNRLSSQRVLGIMENRMETTISIGVTGIMENKMETTISIGIMENEMETTKGGSKQCRAFECQRSSLPAHMPTMPRSHATPQSYMYIYIYIYIQGLGFRV